MYSVNVDMIGFSALAVIRGSLWARLPLIILPLSPDSTFSPLVLSSYILLRWLVVVKPVTLARVQS